MANINKNSILEELKPYLTMSFALYVILYAGILFWFKEVDIYHTKFSTAGIQVAIYNLCRALYIFYLFWIIYQAGNFLLSRINSENWKSISGIDRIAIGFFAGTGFWLLTMLLLGYLRLYTVPVAIAITLPFVLFSYRDVALSFSRIRRAITDWFSCRKGQDWLIALALFVAIGAAISLLLVKGLYPAGGHDYYLHYSTYYKSVIHQGHIWPNEFWIHSYDSKGDGLVWLSMLLSDPLAPQLVTYCFVIASAIVLHQLLNSIAPRTLWPLIGVILYLSFLIYTPGTGEYYQNGGWGDFEKWHELKTSLTIAILWLLAGSFDATGGSRLLKAFAAGSAIVAAVIIDYTFAVYLGLACTLLGTIYFIRRQWNEGWICIGLASVASIILTIMIATNYIATGLFGDIGILAWWRFTNVEKLYQSGALFQAINDYWAYAGLHSMKIFSNENATLLFNSLRLELFYPLILGGICAAVVALFARRNCRPPQNQTIVLIAGLLAWLFVAIALGRNQAQEISFYRYSSITIPLLIGLSVTLWSIMHNQGTSLMRTVWQALVPITILSLCWTAAIYAYPQGRLSRIYSKAVHFAMGRSSIDTAYTNQSAWPGRLPWGAIYPGARGVYNIVGPNTRVWSFHIHAYCMLPDSRFEVFCYSGMTPDDDKVFFGTPEEARSALQKAGLNYFLFSNELLIADPVITTPLFSPNNIGKYFGMLWTDGTTTLLTWRGPNTRPLSKDWLTTYNNIVTQYAAGVGFYYGEMRKIFAGLRAQPHPWGSLNLPWAGNRPYQSVVEPNLPHLKYIPPSIKIISATYGKSCSVKEGNVTNEVKNDCKPEDKQCSFIVDNTRWGDPASGCVKDFSVTYECESNGLLKTITLPPSAADKTITINCKSPHTELAQD